MGRRRRRRRRRRKRKRRRRRRRRKKGRDECEQKTSYNEVFVKEVKGRRGALSEREKMKC